MNRRAFVEQTVCLAGGMFLPPASRRTKHLVFIVNGGGVRKKDYYEDATQAPNVRRLASEGFVFEEDHCERVFSHDAAFAELMQGRECRSVAETYPTILDYAGDGHAVQSIRSIPRAMQRYRPRILVCREVTHDVGHYSFEQYRQTVKAADQSIGQVFNWIKGHRYFCDKTAIVIRPEFGRDDEVNVHGDLHHSYGFYYTHRVASIFWGADFNRGIDRETVIRSVDMAPTVAKLFGMNATYAQGRVIPGLLKTIRS